MNFRILLIITVSMASLLMWASAINEEGGLSHATVDVTLSFLSLPVMISTQGIDNLLLGTKVFLEGGLGVYPTTVLNLQISFISQSLDGRYEVDADNEKTIFALSTAMQVFVKYHIAVDDPALDDMDERVRHMFSTEWSELLSLLQLVDPTYFNNVHTIELHPKSVWSTGKGAEPNGPDSVQDTTATPTSFVIIICVVVGIGMVLSIMSFIPLVRILKNRDRQEQPVNSNATDVGKEPTVASASSNDFQETKSQSSGSTLSDSSGYIQRIYSDDKLHHLSSDLRVQKAHAEDKLKDTLSGLKRSLETSNIFKTRQDVKPVTQLRVSTSSTDNQSDLESPEMKQSSKKEKRKTKLKRDPSPNKLFLSPMGGPEADGDGHQVVDVPKKMIIDDGNGCSVSAMTSVHSAETETLELGVISEELSIALRSDCQEDEDSYTNSTSDDFGSMARSIPGSEPKNFFHKHYAEF